MRLLIMSGVALVGFFIALGAAFLVAWVFFKLSRTTRSEPSPRMVAEAARGVSPLMIVAVGVLAAALGYVAESVSAGRLVRGPLALEITLGYLLGVSLFGIVGGLIYRKANACGFGQLIGVAYGATVGGIVTRAIRALGFH